VLVGVLSLEEQHLRDDKVGQLVLDERRQEDDPLLEQAREDVEGALATRRLLDDHRHQGHTASPCYAVTREQLRVRSGGRGSCARGAPGEAPRGPRSSPSYAARRAPDADSRGRAPPPPPPTRPRPP